MKPAEIVTVVVAIPLVVALFVAEVAESRAPAPQPVARTAQVETLNPAQSPALFDEIVVTAKRTTKG